jgi:hypothetical protein
VCVELQALVLVAVAEEMVLVGVPEAKLEEVEMGVSAAEAQR